ncbi:MAG: PEP-CTERM sorting domain-containing protein [Deferrisomatales bacterium]|nr:PEP-CTERM sorting domain-containing protein [Deferrisomatales bacterium]
MKRTAIGSVAIFALGLAGAVPSYALSIGLTPFTADVAAGDVLSVGVYVTDVGNEVVSAFDLFVQFDSSLLSYTGAAFGPHLGGDVVFDYDFFTLPGSLQTTQLWPGDVVELSELSYLYDEELGGDWPVQGYTPQPDSFVLATVDFTALTSGYSSLGFLTHADLGIAGSTGLSIDTIDVKGRNAQLLEVNVVPEPGTIFLLGTGLLGVAGRARRKRKE